MNAKIIVVGTAFVAAAAAAFYAINGKYPAVEVSQLQQPKLKVETYLGRGRSLGPANQLRLNITNIGDGQVEIKKIVFNNRKECIWARDYTDWTKLESETDWDKAAEEMRSNIKPGPDTGRMSASISSKFVVSLDKMYATSTDNSKLIEKMKEDLKQQVESSNNFSRVVLSTGDSHEFIPSCSTSEILKATIETDKGSEEFNWNKS